MTRLKSDQNSDTPVVTAIAIDRDKNSQYAVKWAVDHLISSSNKNHQCILLHVNSASMHSRKYCLFRAFRAPMYAYMSLESIE